MPRTLKSLIPERGGVIQLPVCAKPVSVGFQRERVKPSPLLDPNTPIDQVSPDAAALLSVILEDKRSPGQQHTRCIRVDSDGPTGVTQATDFYVGVGFKVVGVFPVASLSPAAALVPVLWWEEPCLDTVDGDGESLTFPGVEEGDFAQQWPQVDVMVFVIPTGDSVPHDAVFIGTLQRPQRQDPSKDAVFHIYIERTTLLRLA